MIQGAEQAAVTPDGVRDGDPDALIGLVERRGGAVLAFCEAVCDPAVVVPAAAEIFARFRAAVVAADDASSLNPEVLLLGATRHAAASVARTSSGGGGLRRRLRGPADEELCAQIPPLLAARAEDMLSEEELDFLQQHLEHCAGCRDIEAAFRRAERGYRSPPERPLSDEVMRELLGALASAAPLRTPDAERLLALIEPPPAPVAPEPALVEPAPVVPEPEPVVPQPEALEPAPFETAPKPAEPEPEPVAREPEPIRPEPEPVAPEPAPVAPEPAPEPFAREPEPVRPEPAPEPAEPEHVRPEPAPEPAEPEPVEPEPEPVAREPEPVEPAPEPVALVPPELHHPVEPWSDPDDLDPEPTARHGHPTGEVAVVEAPSPGLPRTRRHVGLPHASVAEHGPIYAYVLPGAAVAIAIVIVLAIAGVLGGDDPAPTSSQAGTAIIQR